jgi:hypothetical protein
LVVFGDESFEIGLIFHTDEEGLRVNPGFEGIAAGDGLAFGGARPSGFLGVTTIGFDLFESGH